MAKKTFLLTIPALIAATSAFANPATPEGAAHLTEVFQSYLGSVPGVVTVAANGDSYTLTLDAAPLIAKIPADAGSASLTPLVMQVTDNGDGTWGVTEDQALSARISVPGAVEASFDVARFTSEGVFDEALKCFSSSKSEMTGIKLSETVTQNGQPPMDVAMTIETGSTESSAVANAEGGVDVTSSVTFANFAENFAAPGPDGVPMPISLTAESYEASGDIAGLRPEAILQLLAWVVAHPTPDAAEADRAGLKSILSGGLPLFGSILTTGMIGKLAVTTPMGNLGIDELGVEVEANGVVDDGMLREAFTLSGLTLPEGVIPDWAAPLLPQNLSIDLAVSDYNLAAPANLALGLLDLPVGQPVPPELQDQMLAALLPGGSVTITLAPGAVGNDSYRLSFEGDMAAGPAAMPTGKAMVSLTGIDAVVDAINAAPDDVKSQAVPALMLVRGMAKAGENGALIWEIDASTPGSVLVNGNDLASAMQ